MSAILPTLSGVVTGILILLFLGIVAWAWSRRRRAEFDATARLPLEEDRPASGRDGDHDQSERAP
jgi:cytochrome c oxidase cbb3-type subunit 4